MTKWGSNLLYSLAGWFCFVCLSLGANGGSDHPIGVGLMKFAERDYDGALGEFQSARDEQREQLLFYEGESYRRKGQSEKARLCFEAAVATSFNVQEARWALLEFANKSIDKKAIETYETALKADSRTITDEYHKALSNGLQNAKGIEDEKKRLKVVAAYFSSGDGYPGETTGDALFAVGALCEAISAYKYAVEQNVPLPDRFISPLGRRLYEKLAAAYKQYAETLTKEKKADKAEVSHASAMAQCYAYKALAVQSPQRTE